MTFEHYFLYIIPNLPDKNYESELEASSWKQRENRAYQYDPYTNNVTYIKEINFNNHVWYVSFRKFPFLKSIMLVIKCPDTIHKEADEYRNIYNVFLLIVKELKMAGIIYYIDYTFKFFQNQNDLLNEKKHFSHSFLFSEITEKNEFHQIDLSSFISKIDFDDTLNDLIKEDIFALVSLSEIARDMEHQFLKNPDYLDKSNVIKAFLGHKTYLLSCASSKKFSSFFKYNLSVIDNLLNHIQLELIDNQNKLLKEIHSVEGGILIISYFIIIDVIFTIFFEITHLALASAFVALIFLYVVAKKFFH